MDDDEGPPARRRSTLLGGVVGAVFKAKSKAKSMVPQKIARKEPRRLMSNTPLHPTPKTEKYNKRKTVTKI